MTRLVTMATLLDAARELLAQDWFDAEATIELLDHILAFDIETQIFGAITHARLSAAGVLGDETSTRVAAARFALSRVIVLLAPQVALSIN